MQASDSVVSLRRRRQPAYEAGSWPARRRCKRPTDEDPSCGGSTLPLPYSGGHAHHAKLSSPGRASVAARRGRSSLLARRLRSATVEVGRGGLDLRRRAARARLVSSVPGASCLLLRPQRQPMWIWRGICLARARLTRDPARWHFEKTASTTRGGLHSIGQWDAGVDSRGDARAVCRRTRGFLHKSAAT
jgi:hypothetical protein